MSKQLDDRFRSEIEADMQDFVSYLNSANQSLAIARQCMINAFDEAAETS